MQYGESKFVKQDYEVAQTAAWARKKTFLNA